MLAPVLVEGPAELPHTLDLVKSHLRVDFSEDDDLIQALAESAVGLLDGWTGVLGRAMVSQTWSQSFATLRQAPLVVGPVAEIVSVVWFGGDGVLVTGEVEDVSLSRLAGGPTLATWSGVAPATARRPDAVQITYEAGSAPEAVPAALRTAFLMLTDHLYANRGDGDASIPETVKALIQPFRNRRL